MSTIIELIGEIGIEPKVNRMFSFDDVEYPSLRESEHMSDTFQEKNAYGNTCYIPPRASILVHKDTPKIDLNTLIESIESL